MMRREEIGIGIINSTSNNSTSPSSSRCQDCGNQAKKDCLHSRCRTCCRNRGLQCQTHVKSTWVPVARRQPRYHMMHQLHQITTPPATVHRHHGMNNHKRSRENLAADALGLEEGDFPGEATFPAVFRCVRVSSMDNVVDQYAYQTSVSIGGHVFTGILYDQGPDHDQPERTVNYVTGRESNSSAGLMQHHQPHDHFATTATATGTVSSSPYSAGPFCAFNANNPSSILFDQYPKS